MDWGDLVNKSGVDSGTASKYMRVLQDLGIVERTAPAFAPQGRGRRHRYRVRDPLTRFWFRFVFPFQDALSSDLSPEAHYARNVEPYLTEHVSVTFEDICRSWVAREYQHTTDSVESWWGNALNKLRADGSRTSEEIDIVGSHLRTATVIGEVKWTNAPMPKSVLVDLRTFKIPALQQAKIDVAPAEIILISKSGFTRDLEIEAAASGVRLVGLAEVVGQAASE